MDMTEARGRLWCASGNFIFVLDVETLAIEVGFKYCNDIIRKMIPVRSYCAESVIVGCFTKLK